MLAKFLNWAQSPRHKDVDTSTVSDAFKLVMEIASTQFECQKCEFIANIAKEPKEPELTYVSVSGIVWMPQQQVSVGSNVTSGGALQAVTPTGAAGSVTGIVPFPSSYILSRNITVNGERYYHHAGHFWAYKDSITSLCGIVWTRESVRE